MNTQILAEKRCHDRQMLNRKVTITTEDVTLNDLKMVDISTCGLSLLSPKTLPEQSIVNLHFSLPAYDKNTSLNITGKIVRSTQTHQQHLLGIQFQNPSQHDLLIMKEFFIYHHRFDA
ncbi:MAG: PilZ domain-containing protein [Thiomicrorhabdus sp.]|nr:PilZ domain-containing protein [Thiomicrorhabdus sp.]